MNSHAHHGGGSIDPAPTPSGLAGLVLAPTTCSVTVARNPHWSASTAIPKCHSTAKASSPGRQAGGPNPLQRPVFVGNHLHGVGVKTVLAEETAEAVANLDITISNEDDE